MELINKDKFVEFKKLGNTYFLMCEPEEVVEGLLNVKIATVHLNKKMTYDEVVSKFIHARYTSDNEIALINNALDNVSELASNEEYKEYMRWRELAKDAASDYLGLEVDLLDKAKADKVKQLTAYDKSSAVNEFTLFGHPTWLELRKREDMRQSLVSLKAKGFEEFTYWLDTTPITLPIAQFESILDTVEVYAIQCFNVTAQHKAAILALESVEDVKAYDFTTGYPEKVSI